MDYYFADHLGTSRVVTNSSGGVLDDSDFYPFGGERPVTSSSGNTYKFTGYERDTESGLDYASARHYSSTLGRFMSPDPLSGSPGNPQSWNRYSYVYNNPLNATDPSGMCSPDDGWSGCDWDTGWDSWDFLGFLSYSNNGSIFNGSSVWSGFASSDGTYFLDYTYYPYNAGFTLIPLPPMTTYSESGNLFYTPTMAQRGLGDMAAALPLAAHMAEPFVNFSAPFVLGFAAPGGEAGIDTYTFPAPNLQPVPGTLTAIEQAEIQAIADKYNTTIDVVGSRAAGEGRNIETDFPKGKGPGTRSDIDFRIDASHPQVDELIQELKGVGNGAGSAGTKWSTTTSPTEPPFIRFIPRKR